MKRQADKETLLKLFGELQQQFSGHNYTVEDNGTAIFDFNYDKYCFTFVLDENGVISLADNVDIYDNDEQYIGNYSLKETFISGIDDKTNPNT